MDSGLKSLQYVHDLLNGGTTVEAENRNGIPGVWSLLWEPFWNLDLVLLRSLLECLSPWNVSEALVPASLLGVADDGCSFRLKRTEL